MDVEEKPRPVQVPAPAMARAVRPGVLIALPAVPFQEQSLFERKVARLRQLEAFMVDFPLPLDVYDACDIMDVTIADEYEALRETDYNSYSMLAIKAAEKRFRAEALRNFKWGRGKWGRLSHAIFVSPSNRKLTPKPT